MTSLTTLDLQWVGHPKCIASALLRDDQTAYIIDPGPSSTLPVLRRLLEAHGLQVSDLNAILLTHIHLDHAGATGSLVAENPQLNVFVHERGAEHMVDPSALLASASKVFENQLSILFGEFRAVPRANLRVLRGGETLKFGSTELRVLYTPGHASHHVTYFDPREGTAFVGDSAGISIEGDPFVLPATPPPDILLEAWDESLDAIASLKPDRLFLTHFGATSHISEHLQSFRKRLHSWSRVAKECLGETQDRAAAERAFVEKVTAEASQHLSPESLAHYTFNGALHLSFRGLARYHFKKQQTAS